jgi:tRNA/rRNA methyltransferase
MIEQLEALLEPRRYFHPPDRAAATRLNLRNIMTKPGWNHLEVRTIRGMLTAMKRRPENERDESERIRTKPSRDT